MILFLRVGPTKKCHKIVTFFKILLFKKKKYSYLYIFFLILVFFFNEFSTNFALGKNYIVSNIKVEEVYDINFDKSKVVDKAFNKAFKILFYKLIENKDKSKINVISLKGWLNFVK